MLRQTPDFPIPQSLLPERLRGLLVTGDAGSPSEAIEVATRYEHNSHQSDYEYVHMLMAAVPKDDIATLGVLSESSNGVVAFSQPDVSAEGGARDYAPSVSGNDYLVASWGTGSFYGFSLADKVWMTLGLSPRSIGGEHQKLIYDDLSEPVFAVAHGEVSNEYYWTQKRNVHWKMRNDYLRTYLWMRGLIGVRVFFYEANLDDKPEWRKLMAGKTDKTWAPEGGWCECRIMEFDGGLRLQVWASVAAVDTQRCSTPDANTLIWPGQTDVMTHDKANALIAAEPVYLTDSFLEKYEQSSLFDTGPRKIYGTWNCSPAYGGQWSFTDCRRVGRNLIRVPMRELYKPKPDVEICHAHAHAISDAEANSFDFAVEHIVEKTDTFLNAMMDLADTFVEVANVLGIPTTAVDLCGFDRQDILDNGWNNYPRLCRLAAVAPLEMTEQNFLSRCKLIHEMIDKFPNGKLKQILGAFGCESQIYSGWGALKLLQALHSVGRHLNSNGENSLGLEAGGTDVDISARQPTLAALFVNSDLRNAEAHAQIGTVQQLLTNLNFDTAILNDGHGTAIDFIFDEVSTALTVLASDFKGIMAR